MLDNYDRIMKKDASCYITEMCNAYEKSNNGITSYPLVEYLLSSVLLRLTGFMEQKLDTLQLILCGNSADFRYNLLRNRNALSSNYDVVKNIYSKFCNLINEIDKTEFCQTQKRYEKSIFQIKNKCNGHIKKYLIYLKIILSQIILSVNLMILKNLGNILVIITKSMQIHFKN